MNNILNAIKQRLMREDPNSYKDAVMSDENLEALMGMAMMGTTALKGFKPVIGNPNKLFRITDPKRLKGKFRSEINQPFNIPNVLGAITQRLK
jgi:hypothetical protein